MNMRIIYCRDVNYDPNSYFWNRAHMTGNHQPSLIAWMKDFFYLSEWFGVRGFSLLSHFSWINSSGSDSHDMNYFCEGYQSFAKDGISYGDGLIKTIITIVGELPSINSCFQNSSLQSLFLNGRIQWIPSSNWHTDVRSTAGCLLGEGGLWLDLEQHLTLGAQAQGNWCYEGRLDL